MWLRCWWLVRDCLLIGFLAVDVWRPLTDADELIRIGDLWSLHKLPSSFTSGVCVDDGAMTSRNPWWVTVGSGFLDGVDNRCACNCVDSPALVISPSQCRSIYICANVYVHIGTVYMQISLSKSCTCRMLIPYVEPET